MEQTPDTIQRAQHLSDVDMDHLPALVIAEVSRQSLHRADGRDYVLRVYQDAGVVAVTREEAQALFDELSRQHPFRTFTLTDARCRFDPVYQCWYAGGRYCYDQII